MREGLGDTGLGDAVSRITPAYAGRTFSFMINSLYTYGSPPLMREGQLNLFLVHHKSGITPAYAGRT